jgi:homoserine O-acetyltransferase
VPIAAAAWHSQKHRLPRGRPAGCDADPNWAQGRYLELGVEPRNGPSRAWPRTSPICRRRRCEEVRAQPAGPWRQELLLQRRLPGRSYLRHQGSTFVDRFDANSYLYITRAIDYFDLAAEHGDVLANAFRAPDAGFCGVSF